VKLATDGVFSSNSVTPSLAYITFDNIQSLRKKHVYTPPYKIANVPGLRLRQKRLDSLTPQNPAEDPYVVAILIALAQEQQRRLQQQEGSQGEGARIIAKDQTSHRCRYHEYGSLVLSKYRANGLEHSKFFQGMFCAISDLARCFIQPKKGPGPSPSGVAADALYIYTANIPCGFLDKFDEPPHYSPSCPVAITYRRVPLASSNMLRKLHRLLCAGLCSFCSCNQEQLL
jgi:hypothetical protein